MFLSLLFCSLLTASHCVPDSVRTVPGLLTGDHVLCELCVSGVLRLAESVPGAGHVGYFHAARCAPVGELTRVAHICLYICTPCCNFYFVEVRKKCRKTCNLTYLRSQPFLNFSELTLLFFKNHSFNSRVGGRGLSVGGVSILRIVGLCTYYSADHHGHIEQYL